MNQQLLDLEAETTPVDTRRRFPAWCDFHRENPHVFRLFVEFANEDLAESPNRVSARDAGQKIRKLKGVETTDLTHKLNDHHFPYYARLLTGLDKRFTGKFLLKNSTFDSTVEEIVTFHTNLRPAT